MGGMRIVAAIAVLLIASACAAGPSKPAASSAHVRLFEATGHEIVVIDSQTHFAVRHLPLGVPSPDWRHLYSINGAALLDIDPASGLTTSTLQLPGDFQLPAATSDGLPGGMSHGGAWLVAQSFDGAATHFLIVSTLEMRVAKDVNLPGRFNFDAISDDGLRLYLIQYLDGREYYVRLFNVASSTLDENIVVDKSSGEQSMTGTRLSGIATRDGGWLFSMYVRESENPFVHVLSLDGPFAFCLDLPGKGYGSSAAEKHWSIAMDQPGEVVYAFNGSTGIVVQIDNSQQFNPQVKRTAQLASGSFGNVGSNSAVVSPDGRRLIAAGSSGVVWVDTRTLTAQVRALPDWHVWSLALSPAAGELYALSDTGRIADLDLGSGTVLSTFQASEGQPVALMRVASV